MEISKNGERVGTIIARLAVRLGDVSRVWVTLVPVVKTSNAEYGFISEKKMADTPYFPAGIVI